MIINEIKLTKTHPENPCHGGVFIEKNRTIMKIAIHGEDKHGQAFECSESTEYDTTHEEEKPLIDTLRAILSKLAPPKHALQGLTPKQKQT